MRKLTFLITVIEALLVLTIAAYFYNPAIFGITGNVVDENAKDVATQARLGFENQVYTIKLDSINDQEDITQDKIKLKINQAVTSDIVWGTISPADSNGLFYRLLGIVGNDTIIQIYKRKNMSVGESVNFSVNGRKHNATIISIGSVYVNWTLDGQSPMATHLANAALISDTSRDWASTSWFEKVYNGNTSDYVVFNYGYSINITLAQNPSNCTPNWTATNQTQTDIEEIITYYADSNNCENNTNKPTNRSYYEDLDNNGRIGNENDIKEVRADIRVKINSTYINNSANYSGIGTQKVELLDGNETLIEFNWNFNTALNLKSIQIEKQETNRNLSYVIIKGLEVSKTVHLEKLNPDSRDVCLIDFENVSVSDFTKYCNSSKEMKLDCPGNESGYTCNITDNKFKITGLSNSAVSEFIEEQTQPTCIPSSCEEMNWSCGTGLEESCNTSITCGLCDFGFECNANNVCEEICQPSWECGEWLPERCPKNETQTRTCNEINSCDSNNLQKKESQTCTYESSIGTIILIILIILVLITGVIVVILIAMKRNKSNSTSSRPATVFKPDHPTNPDQPIMRPNYPIPQMPPQRPALPTNMPSPGQPRQQIPEVKPLNPEDIGQNE